MNLTAHPEITACLLRDRVSGRGGKGDADTVYCYLEPFAEVRGSLWNDGDFLQLQKLLAKHTEPTGDFMHPPGAAVGYVTYEGEFQFRFYSKANMQVRSADFLMPSELPSVLKGRKKSFDGWETSAGLESYRSMVEKARRYIELGDIYQVNLARRFQREVNAAEFDSREFFQQLWAVTAAPMSAWMEFNEGPDKYALMSASPELFLSMNGHQITTRPIKGTRPRDPDPLRDEQNGFELSTNEKEIAELVMITDLERNDLGQFCEYGSVEVHDLVQREAFSHVFHLISTVQGQMKSEVTQLEALRACFPGGSITGAPKMRSMEVIEECENFERGLYTGAIGYFGFDGTAQFNIAIRTAELRQDRLVFHTGSGITWGSDPEMEYEETCHKAAAILHAWDAYQQVTPTKV